MQKTANVMIAFGEFRGIINNMVIRKGVTAQALLDRLQVPSHVLVRVKKGLVFSPDVEIYPLINQHGEELIAAEIRWPNMARVLRQPKNRTGNGEDASHKVIKGDEETLKNVWVAPMTTLAQVQRAHGLQGCILYSASSGMPLHSDDDLFALKDAEIVALADGWVEENARGLRSPRCRR